MERLLPSSLLSFWVVLFRIGFQIGYIIKAYTNEVCHMATAKYAYTMNENWLIFEHVVRKETPVLNNSV